MRCENCEYQGQMYAASGTSICPECGWIHGEPWIADAHAETHPQAAANAKKLREAIEAQKAKKQ